MIEMFKNNAMSFLLKVDAQGVEEMLKYIKTILKTGEEYIQIFRTRKKIYIED